MSCHLKDISLLIKIVELLQICNWYIYNGLVCIKCSSFAVPYIKNNKSDSTKLYKAVILYSVIIDVMLYIYNATFSVLKFNGWCLLLCYYRLWWLLIYIHSTGKHSDKQFWLSFCQGYVTRSKIDLWPGWQYVQSHLRDRKCLSANFTQM